MYRSSGILIPGPHQRYSNSPVLTLGLETYIFLINVLFIAFSERRRERRRDLLLHLFMHLLVAVYMCAGWGSNLQPCLLGQCFNHQSYPASEEAVFLRSILGESDPQDQVYVIRSVLQ